MTHSEQIIRKQLLALLKGEQAHMSFEDAIAGFPLREINRKLPDGSYTPWHLLEHMRIAQWDILEFVINPRHVSPDWPAGYWPEKDRTATPAMWKKSAEGFLSDLKAVEKLARSLQTDLFAPLPHAKNYTIFRELLLVCDHNAYHLGQLVIFKRLAKS